MSDKLKKAFIKELREEMAMRYNVWRKCPPSKGQTQPLFLQPRQQQRYELMQEMLDFFETATELEFNKIIGRSKLPKPTDGQIPLDAFAPDPVF